MTETTLRGKTRDHGGQVFETKYISCKIQQQGFW